MSVALLLGLAPTAAATPGQVSESTGSIRATKASVVVDLRVEGEAGTIFEGPVRVKGHNVTTVAGGTHHCGGTNNGVNPISGPTATSALDTGSVRAGFTFDGPYNSSFDDFFISRIGGETQTSTQFWGVLLNGTLTSVGGCQQQVTSGDEVVWAFDAFNKSHALKLVGPKTARVGKPVTYHLTEVQTGAAIVGADVNGSTTNSAGDATLTFTAPAVVRVKGDRADSIRSNAVLTRVRR